MNIKYMNQPENTKMGDILKKRLQEKFDEAWIVSGIAKDSAIEYLEEDFRGMINQGGKLHVLIGVDRKNTSKDTLLKILEMGASLGINVNGDTSKVETRLYVFASQTGSSYVYFSGGKFSEGGLTENYCMITEIEYLAQEKEAFHTFMLQMERAASIFKDVDKDDITLLAMKGEIVSRIIDRKIPSISELYGSQDQMIGEQIYDESVGLGILHHDELNDMEIEFDEGISLRKNVELEAEKEAKIDAFAETNKTREDLDRLLGVEKEEKEVKKSRIVRDLKESDFEKMTTLFIEAGAPSKGELRIQKGLATLMERFLPCPQEITIEVMDNQTNQSTTVEASVMDNGKGISVRFDVIDELSLTKEDILRMMKLSEGKYKMEVIRENTKEYTIWERYLTSTIKGTKRRFGIE